MSELEDALEGAEPPHVKHPLSALAPHAAAVRAATILLRRLRKEEKTIQLLEDALAKEAFYL